MTSLASGEAISTGQKCLSGYPIISHIFVAKTSRRRSRSVAFRRVGEGERKQYRKHYGRLFGVYISVGEEGEHHDKQKGIPIVVEHMTSVRPYYVERC